VTAHDETSLRGFVARLIGFAPERAQSVEHALRAIALAAAYHAALVLCGYGDLVPVARGLHRHVLGDERPFVLCDPRRRSADAGTQFASRPTGADALADALGGTVCVRAKRLPRDFAELVVAVHDARVRLVICGPELPRLTELVLAPIKVPALATRAQELDRIIDEYVHDAAVALQISATFTEADRHWVGTHAATSLPEVEKGAWRVLALRQTGNVAGAAELLGMGHASLGEWLRRRRAEHTRRAREKPARPGPVRARRDPLAAAKRILAEASARRRAALSG
jgi:hypothetical protein